jgi:hypothetical protein
LSSIINTSAASNKKFHSFTLTDGYGNSRLFVPRGNGKGFFEIARCEVLADGNVPNRDGVLPNAILWSNEEVADLLTEIESRERRLESIESLLKEWLGLRRARSRRAKQKPKQLQKKEVAK